MNRNALRIEAMIILYQIYLYNKNDIFYDLDKILKDKEEFVVTIVKGVLDNNKLIDDMANKYLDNWVIDRLGLTDKAIIEIAIYEMLYTDTPNKVCINEAIEIAKKYSDESVVKMINGILDKVLHNEVNDAE